METPCDDESVHCFFVRVKYRSVEKIKENLLEHGISALNAYSSTSHSSMRDNSVKVNRASFVIFLRRSFVDSFFWQKWKFFRRV